MSDKIRECPSCAMEINSSDEVCPICGYEFPPRSRNNWAMVAAIVLLALLLIIIFLI